MKKSRPILITYIVDLNFLNIFLLIISLFPKFIEQFDIVTPAPTFYNIAYRVLVILTLLVISVGLLKLKRWGFWLMLAYNVVFLIGSIILLFNRNEQVSFNLGPVFSIFGIMLILSAKRYFMKEKK